MFFRLAVSALCVAASITVVSAAKAEDRILFVYAAPLGHNSFKDIGGGKWVERNHKGETVNEFHEVRRDKEYIDLFDKTRKVEVRIYAKKYTWRFTEGGPGDKGELPGEWKR
jgi:hypothetical protein